MTSVRFVVDALCETIHDLRRFVDAHPDNKEAVEELARLELDWSKAVDSLLENQGRQLARLVSEQVDVEAAPLSLAAKYRGACAIYKAVNDLLLRNRELKAALRDELARRKKVRA